MGCHNDDNNLVDNAHDKENDCHDWPLHDVLRFVTIDANEQENRRNNAKNAADKLNPDRWVHHWLHFDHQFDRVNLLVDIIAFRLCVLQLLQEVVLSLNGPIEVDQAQNAGCEQDRASNGTQPSEDQCPRAEIYAEAAILYSWNFHFKMTTRVTIISRHKVF